MKKIFPIFVLMAGMAMGANAQTAETVSEDLDAKYATELLKTGDEAPEISLKTMDGGDFSLHGDAGEIRAAGTYTVVEFWASWCGDCRKDMPAMKKIVDRYKGKNTRFVGVSFDTSAEAWRKSYTGTFSTGDMIQVSELKRMKESKVAADYHIRWIPSYYILDPDGRVALSTVMIDKVAEYLSGIK